MFFYLSFLRPPPSHWSTEHGKHIPITPQITNDLRTEYYHEDVDIYFAWVKCDSNGGIGSLFQPTKLTTWREANAYKEVSVPPPKGIQHGQSWQILLCSNPPESNSIPSNLTVDFSAPVSGFGKGPLPVLSLPILFSSKPSRKQDSDRQKNVERLMKFPSNLSVSSDSAENVKIGPLRILEHLSFDLDKKIWDSGVGLSKWLIDTFPTINPEIPNTAVSPLLHSLSDGPSRNMILELGAGTGLVSIVLAALLRVFLHRPGNESAVTIYASDLPSAMEIIEKNVGLNASTALKDFAPRPLVLDWEDELLPAEISEGVDLVVMADVTYNTASFPALVGTLKKLSSLPDGSEGRRKPPLVLLAYKERHPDERTLWSMIKDIGLAFEEIARVPGAGGAPVEIYIGKFSD
ncbi:hypothetical protein SCHPADRAFT_900110 [Schizopora paradoxa]|uniref:Methyltransferase-domain-containing protein n=1 Tax=Schizopora paradoxa TaxID=27342 RepID=A0A0H2S0S3_9AGAM|nr:hypothetical protein SCHPADRAFT_900110 [Schizopora paradoxa]